VIESVADAFVERAFWPTELARATPLDPETDVGTVIHETRRHLVPEP
jgi:acyl-CoA reductase-like NAD-dependent aldehyde dehydrogenase